VAAVCSQYGRRGAPDAGCSADRAAYAWRYGVWVSLGLLAGLVSVTTVLAFGVPGYDNLARVHQASFSFSHFNPVTNAVRVMKSAKAHILAEDRKPAQPPLAAKKEPIAI
jgi:hypothetical protein